MNILHAIFLSVPIYAIFILAVCLFLKDLANDDDDHPAT